MPLQVRTVEVISSSINYFNYVLNVFILFRLLQYGRLVLSPISTTLEYLANSDSLKWFPVIPYLRGLNVYDIGRVDCSEVTCGLRSSCYHLLSC